MKNVLSLACGLLMATQAMAVSVSNVCGKFVGNLVIGDESYDNKQVYVLPGTVANTITFVLPDFSYGALNLGDIVLVDLAMNDAGELTLENRPLYIKAINERAIISFTTIEDGGMTYSSGLSSSGAMALLQIVTPSLPEPLFVIFMGEKIYGNYVLPNSNFEAGWSDGETSGWNSFKAATGTFASMVNGNTQQFTQQPGYSGHGVCLTSNMVMSVKANGTMTNGQVSAGAMTATDPANNTFSDPANTGYNTPFIGNPDSIAFWTKFVPADRNPNNSDNEARMHTVITTNARYQDPEGSNNYAAVKVAEATSNYRATADLGWQRIAVPFVYSESVSPEQAAYILATFTTCSTAGGGSTYRVKVGGSFINPKYEYHYDSCYIDEIQLIYSRALNTLTFEGQNVTGNVWTTSEEYSDELYTIVATPKSRFGKAFVGYNAENNFAVVYSVGSDYPANTANYSVCKIQMAPASTTDISNTSDEAVKAIKFFRNGQLYIRRGNQIYNIQGIRVK